jgi:hypothetical protein
MRNLLFTVALVVASITASADDRLWNLDTPASGDILVRGDATVVTGVDRGALSLDGHSLVELQDSAKLHVGDTGITFLVWVNPFAIGDEKRMIAAKNRYGKGEREWGVMIDDDGKYRLYLWQGTWKTITARLTPSGGHWHRIGVVVRRDGAELWVNGRLEGRADLSAPFSATDAPITLGGVFDGSPRQTLSGAVDGAVFHSRALSAEEMQADYTPVAATLPLPEPPPAPEPPAADPIWTRQAGNDAREDRTSSIFLGRSPDKLACDTTLRAVPDGSWVHVMLGGGDKEPDPRNAVFLSRSPDEGKSWSAAERIDFGFPRSGNTIALVPTELMIHGGRCTLFFATHDGAFGGWKEWSATSPDSCRTWDTPRPAPGRLHDRTFIRNHIVTRDGRLLLPFQHYVGAPRPDPVNGVLISGDGGQTWSEHGEIRLTKDRDYRGWAENNIVELRDGRIAMIIRADKLGGVLYYAESTDGGVTWPEFATPTAIPNPGSKATLYGLGGDTVALLHNPNPRSRSPLALWISFDGMQSWPYQRILRGDLAGRFNYPDGFVSPDRKWLHFAFDHDRDKAIHVSARLPEIPPAPAKGE